MYIRAMICPVHSPGLLVEFSSPEPSVSFGHVVGEKKKRS